MNVVPQYKFTVPAISPPKTERPRKTSEKQDRFITRLSLQDRFKSKASYACDVSRKTVSTRLTEEGLNGRIPAMKPLISK